MSYIEIFKEMVSTFKVDIEKYLSGDKADYVYKKQHTDKEGDTDGNYNNRCRLCYGLYFDLCDIPEPKRENIIRELFVEEIISRENESFQGIGINLELLSALMENYRRSEDNSLYERAKNANFDCQCGYDIDRTYSEDYSKDFESYSSTIYDCIYNACDVGCTDYVCRFVDVFKQGEHDGKYFKALKWIAEYTNRDEDYEQAIKGYFDSFARSPQVADIDRLNAYEGMISWLASRSQTEKAFDLLVEGTQVLKNKKYNGLDFYKLTYEIMLADSNLVGKVWDYAGKFAESELKSGKMAPICYGTVRKCAECAGDTIIINIVKPLQIKEQKSCMTIIRDDGINSQE